MKIEIYSDIHNEFRKGSRFMPSGTGDVIVFGGDICSQSKIEQYYEDVFKKTGKTVVFINGNHEYYDADKNELDKRITTHFKENENIHFLNDDYVDVGNVRFIGSTLWTNFNDNQNSIIRCPSMLSDFRLIDYNGRRISALDMCKMFNKSLKFITKTVNECPEDKTPVVITHFAPSKKLKHVMFGDDFMTNYFNPVCDEEILKFDRDVHWIYGHNHCNAGNYKAIGKTTFYTNQMGYPREGVVGNVDGLMLEL